MTDQQISSASQTATPDERTLLYKLLSVSARLLPDERVNKCSKYLIHGADQVTIIRNPADQKAWYHGVQHCSSIWNCPVCANRVTEYRRRELTEALRDDRFNVVMFTYTLRHKKDDSLSALLAALQKAYKRTKSGRFYQTLQADFGIAGSIRTIEVTWSPDNGWHVHIHELMILWSEVMSRDNPLFRIHMGRLHTRLRKKWSQCLEKLGRDASWERGVNMNARRDVSQTYIAKLQLARELTRSVTKKSRTKHGITPFGMLDKVRQGESSYGALFQEYATEFKGTRQLFWSHGLKALLQVKDVADHEITDEMVTEAAAVPFEELATLYWDEWWILVKNDRRGELLKEASRGGKAAVEQYLDELGVELGVPHWCKEPPP